MGSETGAELPDLDREEAPGKSNRHAAAQDPGSGVLGAVKACQGLPRVGQEHLRRPPGRKRGPASAHSSVW